MGHERDEHERHEERHDQPVDVSSAGEVAEFTETTDVEEALSAFAPAASRVGRDRILFAAGEEAGRRAGRRASSLRLWQGLTVALSISTMVLAWGVVNPPGRDVGFPGDGLMPISAEVPNERGDRIPVEHVVTDTPAPRPSPEPAPPTIVVVTPNVVIDADVQSREIEPGNYVALRHHVLVHGVDSLPTRPVAGRSSGAPPASRQTFGSLRRRLIDDSSL